ncbi:MAG: hypothetical protein VKN33_00145 [Candidatus Sericytochromatia bacterium]|nr:hypothetical protein [Candidatus Sericytochromatia bacterium]
MSDMNSVNQTHATLPKYRLFQQRSLTSSTPAAGYASDAFQATGPVGGSGTDPALLAQTDQLMRSPNARDKFQAIVNLTKVSPQDAIPRLQALATAQGQDPQVVQLANEALRVMSQMVQMPQQPQQSPQPVQTSPAASPVSANPAPSTYQMQPVTQPTYNPGVNMANMSLQDAQFLFQTLQTNLTDEQSIRQIAALAQAHPQLKEPAYNLLLNHAYHSVHPSVAEALRALGGFNNPQLVPYLQMIQRHPAHAAETREVAVNLMRQFAAQAANPATPGAASNNPGVSVEYIRAMEFELRKGENEAMTAMQQIRQALGPDARAQGPLRQEIVRVLITHIATSNRPATVAAAARLLGEMGAREMNTLQYLDAVARNPGQAMEARDAAKNAVTQILSTPAQ